MSFMVFKTLLHVGFIAAVTILVLEPGLVVVVVSGCAVVAVVLIRLPCASTVIAVVLIGLPCAPTVRGAGLGVIFLSLPNVVKQIKF